MLEKPDIRDEQLIDCLGADYGLRVTRLTFLPLGADVHSAAYRADTVDAGYFVKLRSGAFDELAVVIPRLLHEQGMAQVIAPIPTSDGRLSSHVAQYAVVVSPFVEGRNGVDRELSDHDWTELGSAMRAIHRAAVPEALRQRLPREAFSPEWRERVRAFQAHVQATTYPEPSAARLAALLRDQRQTVSALVGRAELLGDALRRRDLPLVVCHGDLHGWNVLIDADDRLYVVDWDTLILGPKERDLMFVGAGIGGSQWHSEGASARFLEGYGPADIDATAVAYYRCERVVQDIAAYCEQLLLTEAGATDRPSALAQLARQFDPGGVIEIALAADAPR